MRSWSRACAVGVVAGLLVGSAAGSATASYPMTATDAPAATSDRALSVPAMAHRLLVVSFAGRRPHHVGPRAAARNQRMYGVRTPAQVIRRFRPGGVVYFSDNVASVDQVRRLSAGLRRAARREGYRLLIMTDQEGGRVSRLPGRVARNQPAAASYDGRARPARRDARKVGAAMRRMGVRVDLAPVADVNTVGDAGVIGDRSFGSRPRVVSRLVRTQVCGYHNGGVATTIKHWPGHGSTRVDSHDDLPKLTLPVRRWKRVHLPPFRRGIATRTDLVMVGHLAYPALDRSGRPATLSRKLNAGWLRGRLGFRGVVVTDALNMGALREYGGSARLAVRAYRAGSDLLLMPSRPRAAARGLVRGVRREAIDRADVGASMARLRRLVDKLGLRPGPATLADCRGG